MKPERAARSVRNVVRDVRSIAAQREERRTVSRRVQRTIDRIAARLELTRDELEAHVRGHGPVRVKGVGTAELTHVPTHVRITDSTALVASLFDALDSHPEGHGLIDNPYVLVRDRFRRWAVNELELDELGNVIVKSTGARLLGVELVERHTTLRVRPS